MSFTTILEKMETSERERVIARQLQDSISDKLRWQSEWRSNEVSIYDIGTEGGAIRMSPSFQEGAVSGVDQGEINFMGINPNNQNLQLVLATMVSNPPVAMATPTDSEPRNKRAAIASEALTSYARKKHSLDRYSAKQLHSTLLYGSGFIKQIYSNKNGFYLTVDSKTGAATNVGDVEPSVPRIWDMFFDPNATIWRDVTWSSERIFPNVENAVEFFGPELEDLIRSLEIDQGEAAELTGSESYLFNLKYGCVEIFERWEPGLPSNDFRGSLIYHLRNGRILKEHEITLNGKKVTGSPCTFRVPGMEKTVTARLPYSFLSCIEVENSVWGRSPAANASRKQWVLNALAAVSLRTAKAMGIPRLVIANASTGNDNDNPVTDDVCDIINLSLESDSGGHQPYTLQPASTSPDIKFLMELMMDEINGDWGVNDAMRGKQQREQSALNLQVSIQQGQLIHEDFFSKYVDSIEDTYSLNQSYIRKYWKTKRKVEVVGKDHKLFVDDLEGADIAGGYDLHFERGTGFALDPITRQEQIRANFALYQELGIDTRVILRMMRIADHRGLYEDFDLADIKAQKIIKKISETGEQVKPRYPEDHIGIALAMHQFARHSEYDELDEDIKDLIDEHIQMREDMAARKMAGKARSTGTQQPIGGMTNE